MANNNLLEKINTPQDLKNLDFNLLSQLSAEINVLIQSVVGKIGGHLSSPLGVVDLTIALHYAYNSPKDKLIWDVGHQAYTHKIITDYSDVYHFPLWSHFIGIILGSLSVPICGCASTLISGEAPCCTNTSNILFTAPLFLLLVYSFPSEKAPAPPSPKQ